MFDSLKIDSLFNLVCLIGIICSILKIVYDSFKEIMYHVNDFCTRVFRFFKQWIRNKVLVDIRNKRNKVLYGGYLMLQNLHKADYDCIIHGLLNDTIIPSNNYHVIVGLNKNNKEEIIHQKNKFIYYFNGRSSSNMSRYFTIQESKKMRIQYNVREIEKSSTEELKKYHCYSWKETLNGRIQFVDEGIPTRWLQFNEWYERNWIAFWTLVVTFISNIF